MLARLRVVEGEPAFEVLVPFVVDDGPTVLVDRGYVRPEDGSRVPAIRRAPTGTVTVTGRLRDSETVPPDKEPFTEQGFRQVYAIDTHQVSALTGVPLAGSYVQLSTDQPGGLGVIPLPHLDAGPFLSYGIQWIVFGVVAPIGLGYFVYSELKVRRRERDERAGGARPESRPRRGHRRGRNSPTATAGAAEPAAATPQSRPHPPRPLTRPATAAPPGAGRPPSGGRPSPSVGRICSSWRYCVGPPRRTPSAPANAASTTPALGLGCAAASRRQARAAPPAEPPTTGAHSTTSVPATRAPA